MTLDMFLQMDTIQGTSTNPNHKGAIDVLAYSWGLSHSPPNGTTASKPNLQDFSFTIWEDIYSPSLFKACVLGTVIKTVTFTLYRASDDTPTVPNTTYQLNNVRVTSLNGGASGGEDRPTQNLTLDFAAVHYTTNDPPQSDSNTFGWNVNQSKPV